MPPVSSLLLTLRYILYYIWFIIEGPGCFHLGSKPLLRHSIQGNHMQMSWPLDTRILVVRPYPVRVWWSHGEWLRKDLLVSLTGYNIIRTRSLSVYVCTNLLFLYLLLVCFKHKFKIWCHSNDPETYILASKDSKVSWKMHIVKIAVFLNCVSNTKSTT